MKIEDYVTHDRSKIGNEEIYFPYREELREEYLIELFTKEAFGRARTKKQKINKIMYLLKQQEQELQNIKLEFKAYKEMHERDFERFQNKLYEKLKKQMIVQSFDNSYMAATFREEQNEAKK